jgi:hypothetical protein
MQSVDIEDKRSKIPPDRIVDLESELYAGNEASTAVVMSKNSKILGSTLN